MKVSARAAFAATHPRRWSRRPGACLAVMMALGLGSAWAAASPPGDAAALLEQAYAIKTADHARFVQLLQQLHQPGTALSPDQQWRLRYLDGWEGSFTGDYAKAEPLLRDVADHATDTDLQALAAGTLLNILAISHHYEEAFERADRLAAQVPHIRERKVAYVALSQLSQLMASAQQVGPAATYARQMMQFSEPGQSMCRPYVYLFGALVADDHLPPTAPIFRQAIDACTAAGEPMFADTVELDLARRLAETGQPKAALELLRRLLPELGMPAGTEIHYRHGTTSLQDVYSGSAWALEQRPRG